MEENFVKYNTFYVQNEQVNFGHFYLPSTIEMFHLKSLDRVTENTKYEVSSYIGVAPYTKESWEYAQNKNTETFDVMSGDTLLNLYPVLNMPNFKAYNIYDRYIVYIIKDITAERLNPALKLTDIAPSFPYDVAYFTMGQIDEQISGKMADVLCNPSMDKDKKKEVLKELAKSLERKTKFIHVYNFVETKDRDIMADCVIVDLDADTMSINEETISLDAFDNAAYSMSDSFLYLSDYKEYSAATIESMMKKKITKSVRDL